MASDGWIYDVMGENAKRFEKETGIKVSFTIYAPHVYFRALQTMLASGRSHRHLSHAIDEVVPRQRDRSPEVCIDLTGGRMDKTPEAGVAPAGLVQG